MSSDQTAVASLLQKAQDAFDRDDWQAAARHAKMIVDLEASNFDAWAMLANVYEALNDIDKAISAAEMCTELEPNSVNVHVALARMFFKAEQPDEGLQRLEYATRLPEGKEAYEDYVRVLLDMDQDSTALSAIQRFKVELPEGQLDSLEVQALIDGTMHRCWFALPDEPGKYVAVDKNGIDEMESAIAAAEKLTHASATAKQHVETFRELVASARTRKYEGGFAVPIGAALFGLILAMSGGACTAGGVSYESGGGVGVGIVTLLVGLLYIACAPLYVFAARVQQYRLNKRLIEGEEGGGDFLRTMMKSDGGSAGQVVMGFLMGMCCLGAFSPLVVAFHLIRNYAFDK